MGRHTKASDIWAIGMTLLELCSGVTLAHLMQTGNAMEMMMKVVHHPIVAPPHALSVDAQHFFELCTAHDAKDRCVPLLGVCVRCVCWSTLTVCV